MIETDNNFLYRVTQSGYKASDDLEQQIGSEKIKCKNCNYHGASDKKDECPICQHPTGEKESVVLNAIRKNPSITRGMLAELLGYSEKTIERVLKNLIEKGIIERSGSSKAGSWKIK